MGSIERIQNVARRVKKARDQGHQLAVVVSAMSGETDRLISLVGDMSPVRPDTAEYDSIVSTGEQVSAGLLALALHEMNVPARSFLGWQLPMHCDNAHSKARIEGIEPENLMACIESGRVAIIAGFQGISDFGRITTLGRGGSDTSAVAIAAALQADRCDIYTDVDGVYTTDPRIVSKARKIDRITAEEMLEMASLGAKVLQTRSVALARQHGVAVQVLSSFEDKPGTMVVEEDETLEQQAVTGIAYSRNEAKVTLVGLPDLPGIAAKVFGPLADANINVDMIVQSVSADGQRTDMTFTVAGTDLDHAKEVLSTSLSIVDPNIDIQTDADVVKISVIGTGMRSHAGTAFQMFETLSARGINIQAISTSEIKISVLIAAEFTELALRSLHTAYELDAA